MTKRTRYLGKNLDIVKLNSNYIGYYDSIVIIYTDSEENVIKEFNKIVSNNIHIKQFKVLRNKK